MKMLVRFMALVLGGVCAAAPGQSGKRPMTFADLQAMKRVSDPQISPSGRWVLFSVTDVSLEKNSKTNHLWVVPLAFMQPNPISEPSNVQSFRSFMMFQSSLQP